MPALAPEARTVPELTISLSIKRTPPPVASTLPALIAGDPVEIERANPLLALTAPPLVTVSWPAINPRSTPTIVPPLRHGRIQAGAATEDLLGHSLADGKIAQREAGAHHQGGAGAELERAGAAPEEFERAAVADADRARRRPRPRAPPR